MAKLQFISGIFKIHNPSAWRRQVLDHAFVEYTKTMATLLDWVKENLDLIREEGKYRLMDQETGEVKSEKYTDKSIVQVLPSLGKIQADIPSCLREALISNTASMLASYFELEKGSKQEAGFPLVRDPSPQAWPNSLEELCLIGCDLEEENKARDKLLKISRGDVMPIHFRRSRDFAILTNDDKSQFFLWLPLLPKNSELARKADIGQGNLVDINTRKVFTYKGERAILVPVELGQRHDNWHWQYQKFIQPVLEGKAFIKAGKLVKEGNNYFFHVSMGFEVPEVYEPETYLGIDRGVLHSVAYGLVDKAGAILDKGHSNDPFRAIRIRAGQKAQAKQKRGLSITRRDYKQKELDGILHRLVNDVLKLAVKHKAMIVLEDLEIKNVGKFYKSAYGKFYKFLDYKATWYGVPIYKRRNQGGQFKPGVWAAYSSMICIYCGELVDRDDRVVSCSHCGRVEHSDEAAGVNIARRALYRAKDWGANGSGSGDWRAFHRSFANQATFEAKDDLRNRQVEAGKEVKQLSFV